MLAGLLPPLPGGGLLGGGTMAAAEVMQGQLRDQLPGGWSVLQGPYPQGYPAVFHPGGTPDASGQMPILPGHHEREGGTMAEEASTSRVELSHGDRERQRGGPQPDQALRPCRVPDPVPEQYEGELGGQHGRDLVTVGAMSRQQSPINPWSAEKIKQTMNLPQSQSQEAGETVEFFANEFFVMPNSVLLMVFDSYWEEAIRLPMLRSRRPRRLEAQHKGMGSNRCRKPGDHGSLRELEHTYLHPQL